MYTDSCWIIQAMFMWLEQNFYSYTFYLNHDNLKPKRKAFNLTHL